MTRGRNPLVAATATGAVVAVPGAEAVALDALPGPLAGRRFRYVVAQNVLDRDNVAYLLEHIFALLEDGGRAIFIETNPWNPMSAARRAVNHVLRRPYVQALLSRTQLYELLSEIGFIRVSARFTDFVYRPLAPTPGMAWVVSNISVLLENMPLVRSLAGRIVLHAQRPPRSVPRAAVSLCGHDMLRGAVSFVVPCHNEAMNIPALVDGLRGHYGDYVHEIVLVNDNSTDGTAAVIDRLAAEDPRIVPVHRAPPNGVGLALRDGFAAATGRYVMSMDCDFQHLLPEMEDMFDAAAEGADVVFGSRFSRQSVLINYPFGKILANRSFHLLANLVVRLGRPARHHQQPEADAGRTGAAACGDRTVVRRECRDRPATGAAGRDGARGADLVDQPHLRHGAELVQGADVRRRLCARAVAVRPRDALRPPAPCAVVRSPRHDRGGCLSGLRRHVVGRGLSGHVRGRLARRGAVFPDRPDQGGAWPDRALRGLRLPVHLAAVQRGGLRAYLRGGTRGGGGGSPPQARFDALAQARAADRERRQVPRFRLRQRRSSSMRCRAYDGIGFEVAAEGRDAERPDRHRRHPVRPPAIGRPGRRKLRLHRRLGCAGAPRRSGATDAAADDPVEAGRAALSHAAEQRQLGRPRVGREMEHAAAGTPLVFRPRDAAAVSWPLRLGGGHDQADPLSGRSGHRFPAGPPDLWRRGFRRLPQFWRNSSSNCRSA